MFNRKLRNQPGPKPLGSLGVVYLCEDFHPSFLWSFSGNMKHQPLLLYSVSVSTVLQL